MGSSRLPGKVLMPILGRPMLELQIERIKQSSYIDRVIIATTDSSRDDEIAELATKIGCLCFRGSEHDVFGRIVNSLKKFDVGYHVEFQGDNPLPDISIIDRIIKFYIKNRHKYDYVTNCLKTTYPPGCEVSIYESKTLIDAEKWIENHTLREHVGIHIYMKPNHYRVKNLEAPRHLKRPNLHLEVDTIEDFTLVNHIYESLYPLNPKFSTSDIIDFIDKNPSLININKNIERRWRQFRIGD